MVLTSNLLNIDLILYNIRRPVLSGLFLLLISQIYGYNYNPKISNIKIIGLFKTKPYIVKREIQQSINSPLDSSIVKLDRNRIFNLGLFDEVNWQLVPLEDGSAVLQFSLIESINRLNVLFI